MIELHSRALMISSDTTACNFTRNIKSVYCVQLVTHICVYLRDWCR